MITFFKFLRALPALFRLVQKIEQRIEEAGIDLKVGEGIQTVHEAFDAKDPAKLNALFNSNQ